MGAAEARRGGNLGSAAWRQPSSSARAAVDGSIYVTYRKTKPDCVVLDNNETTFRCCSVAVRGVGKNWAGCQVGGCENVVRDEKTTPADFFVFCFSIKNKSPTPPKKHISGDRPKKKNGIYHHVRKLKERLGSHSDVQSDLIYRADRVPSKPYIHREEVEE